MSDDPTPTNPYEAEEMLGRYLLFHYGIPEEILPWAHGPRDALDFPRRCVTDCFSLDRLGQGSRALDLGCAVGGSTFEMARWCGEVIGVDASVSLIRAAEALRTGRAVSYRRREEGDSWTAMEARAPEGIDRARVRFLVGDAMEPDPGLGPFDAVLLANLIDRLPDPGRCLARLPALVKPGGCLVIVSPYTWLEQYTPRDRWLGTGAGGTLAALRQCLSEAFRPGPVRGLPFLMREHARKYQWSMSEASVWWRL